MAIFVVVVKLIRKKGRNYFMPREIEEKKTIYMKSKNSIHASYAFYVAPLIVYVHKFRKNSMSGNIEHRIN